jgi:hypothetical protein
MSAPAAAGHAAAPHHPPAGGAAAPAPGQGAAAGAQRQPGRLVRRAPGARVHFCVACLSPIAVYGRLLPCMHTFCLACATDMPQCFMCAGEGGGRAGAVLRDGAQRPRWARPRATPCARAPSPAAARAAPTAGRSSLRQRTRQANPASPHPLPAPAARRPSSASTESRCHGRSLYPLPRCRALQVSPAGGGARAGAAPGAGRRCARPQRPLARAAAGGPCAGAAGPRCRTAMR